MATEFRALCESYITKLSSGSNTLEDVVTMMDQSTGANSDKKTCLDVALRRAVLNLVNDALFSNANMGGVTSTCISFKSYH